MSQQTVHLNLPLEQKDAEDGFVSEDAALPLPEAVTVLPLPESATVLLLLKAVAELHISVTAAERVSPEAGAKLLPFEATAAGAPLLSAIKINLFNCLIIKIKLDAALFHS